MSFVQTGRIIRAATDHGLCRWVSRLLGACAMLAPGTGAHAQTYTFDAGSQGWQVYNISISGGHIVNPTPASVANIFDGSLGLPPGSLRVPDLTGETWIGAPAEINGDRSAIYGQPITMDIFYRYADNAVYPAVALAGPAFTLYVPLSPPALNTWLHWAFPLVPGQWRINGPSGAVATEADIRSVLANVHGFYIHTEWMTGPDDTSVDNISIGCDAPALTGPYDSGSCPRGLAPFSVGVAGAGPFTYQWQLETAPNTWTTLGNDPLPLSCGGFAFATPINSPGVNIGVRDCDGPFNVRCIVTGACGVTTSNPALLRIGSTCDFNVDGSTDLTDVFDLADAIAGGTDPNPGCKDFNLDGSEDLTDVFDLADAVAGGNCP